MEPPALELAAGAEAFATVRLIVPADAPSNSEASIGLTATSNGTAPFGGFNGAHKTLVVIRNQPGIPEPKR